VSEEEKGGGEVSEDNREQKGMLPHIPTLPAESRKGTKQAPRGRRRRISFSPGEKGEGRILTLTEKSRLEITHRLCGKRREGEKPQASD